MIIIGGSSFIDILSFALACATGSPIEDENNTSKKNNQRDMNGSSSTGFHWESSLSDQTPSSTQNLKKNSQGK